MTNPQSTDRLGRLSRLTLKELREILRDRRTIITLVLMPLLLYPVLSIAFQRFFISNLAAEQNPRYILGFRTAVDERYVKQYLLHGQEELEVQQGGLSAQPESHHPELSIHENQDDDLERVVREGIIDVGIRISDGQTQRLDARNDVAVNLEVLYNPESRYGRAAAAYVERCLLAAGQGFLAARLQALGVSQRAVPIRVDHKTVQDPLSRGGSILAAVIPFILILMTITGAVYPAIDLTAGERERGTLEVLVAAPIPRVGLLFAKYVAVVTVALLTATVNLTTMTVTILANGLGRFFGDAGVSTGMIAAVFGLLLLFAAFFSAVLLVLTSFARSFKEAQAYLIPLMLVSLAPGMLSLMPGLELAGLWLVTPLANIVLLGRDLFDARASGLAAMIVVLSTVLYAGAAIALAARIFGAESVLYSTHSGWSDLWRRPREPQVAPTMTSALGCLALLFPAYFLANSLQARLAGGNITLLLLAGAASTAVLFGGFPLLAAWRGHVPLTQAFRLRLPAWPAWIAALLLGFSLWMVAHELVVIEKKIGLVTLDEKVIELAKNIVAQLRNVPLAIVLLALAVTPAVFEELFFRGYVLGALRATANTRTAILGSAVLFGMFHLLLHDSLALERFAPSAMLGAILAWVCLRTGSVFPGMLLHACHNGLLLTIAYYQPQLESRGWGGAENEHLPLPLFAGAAAMIVAGTLLLAKCGKVEIDE